jgi:hypothetical protein
VVLTEGAAGVNFNFGTFRLVDFPFTPNDYFGLFGMKRFLWADLSLIDNMEVGAFLFLWNLLVDMLKQLDITRKI